VMRFCALGGQSAKIWFSLWLLGACDFGGDRSLGSIDSATQPTTAPSATNWPQAGAAGAITVEVSGPPACNPVAPSSECAEGEFCAVNTACGKSTDPIRGYCQQRPPECGVPSGFEVVCGCDTQFYASRCLAWQVGVSIATLGICAGVACLTSADCNRFAESCVDSYGSAVKGAACYESVCSCASSSVIL